MATPTTALVDVVAALMSVLNAYHAAHPTLLRAVYSARPGGVSEVPFAFVGPRNETVVHTSGTRDRTLTPTVVVVDTYGDNAQTMDRLDVLQDGLMDAFTAGVRVMGQGVIEQTAVRDGDIEFTGPERVTFYRARTFEFDRTLVTEGRN